ncbi:MAG: AraC family transcriptional regulator [Gammaproteobacteria bacterium]|nr:AraC family transcriptional regulator [Gammaproteobacteria bacterium]
MLSLVRLQSSILSHLQLREPWGLHCPKSPQALFYFYAVLSGRAVLTLEQEAPLALADGDLVILPHGDANTIASTMDATAVSLLDTLEEHHAPMWTEGSESTIIHLDHGGDGPVTQLLSGGFYFGAGASPFAHELPRVLRVGGDEHPVKPLLDAALHFISDEHARQQPGAAVAAARLADLIFLQALRHHWSQPGSGRPGLLRGLGDPRIRRALEAMHQVPQEPWSIARLARIAGMSRSAFTDQFHDRVGLSPKLYLTRWRMQLAADRLAEGRHSTARIAEELGYQSATTFTKCFRRVHGVPPGRYRRQRAAHQG